ncbi:hypothetical protein BDZ94DRAFT_985969 [Collybia nuda]|uniref:F-box domain-containing protein n=1 Tax=Collybia nuda TaxID=64659 RepID=A0A9P6CBT0_9AGAR|nr:hypothetical protein BDZ94DRAFT_985969 [Collybia nuda]
MSALSLSDLPIELVIHVLCYLPLSDLASCQLTHSWLCALIRGSILIRFNKAIQAAGLDANPHYRRDRSIKDRLGLLARIERGWWDFNVEFARKVDVGCVPSGIYGLTDGMYVISDGEKHALQFCTLPETAEEETEWHRVEIDSEVIGVGMARHEHDLMAVVTSTPEGDTFKIEIKLLEVSSGEPHPCAQYPEFPVTDSPGLLPEVSVEVVGDNLALVVTNRQHEDRPEDHFYIYEWKTGKLKMRVTAPNGSYSCMLFLTPDILLLPNAHGNAFEFWEIPTIVLPTNAPKQPLGTISLPLLDPGHVISRISCRCEPNPSVYGTPFSTQSFQSSPLDAIAMFTIHIQPLNIPSDISFMIFVHRRSLLRLCPSNTGVILDRSVKTPWMAWGPPVTRCFNMNSLVTRWTATAAGQRYTMFLAESASLVYLDFNPVRTRRLRLVRGKKRPTEPHIIPRESGKVRSWFETKPNTIRHHAFMYPVASHLPYMVCSLDKAHGYDGVLMDEQRLIGLKTNEMGKVQDIEILHLGLTCE